ncbi:DUF4198 domain-containing protein [Acanthopleuribacter pedis]|uniref:DUF4198 domain-containing protein n=1 Tax=Acanthopleuribacter pedis TaxID=442870 RepID=A0A8J7QCU0_9BACT|nr:DUF4198 domain-containing protein [Acanthopleuribacter pedis]MBO1322152.1 DUF4198 domain-containing protein [Acanthopleuribacter pedis]
MFRTRLFSLLFSCWTLATFSSLLGHDFWLSPHEATLNQPGPVKIQAFLGDHFRGEAIIPSPKLVDQFWLRDEKGLRPVKAAGMLGLAAVGRVEATGPCLIAYAGKAKFLQLPATKFETYLEEEHLTAIRDHRREQATQNKPGREFFSRCAKALVAVGAVDAVSIQQMVAGHPLEITPQSNPFQAQLGERLDFKLTFEGRPLPNQRIVLYRRTPEREPLIMHTDERGRITVTVDHQGAWMLKAVHMVPHKNPKEAEWRSYWASTTFSNAAGAAPSATTASK